MDMKNPKKLLFVIMAIAIVIAVIVAYYVSQTNQPRYIFDKTINQYLSSDEENLNFKTMKVNADLEMSIDSKENEAKEMAELLNDAKFSFSTELDNEKQEEIIGIKMVKADEELINANMKLEAESQNLYVNLGEFFEKTIQLDMSEISDETFEIADASMISFSQEINTKKAETIMKKEIKSQLKNEYFSAEKVTIDEENVTKNKLRLTVKEFAEVVKNIANNLAENKEFIECFEDGEKLKEDLKEFVDEVEELEVDDEDVYVEIDIYTQGITKKIRRVDFLIEEGEETATVQIKKLNDEEYEYGVFDNEDKAFEGTIKIKENDDKFEFEISAKVDETIVKLQAQGNVVYDEELSNFDTENAVNYKELTTQDIYQLLGNFMNSKLYKISEEFSNTNTTLLEDDERNIEDTKKEKTSNKEANIIKTYEDVSMKFNIPDGFEVYSQESDTYKLFEKELDNGEVEVDVASEYSTLEEYINEVKEKAEYYEKEDDYENVKISDVEELEIKGNKFKKITITYNYEFLDNETPVTEAYIAYEVDKNNLYTVEINGANLISDSELEQFLSIEKLN